MVFETACHVFWCRLHGRVIEPWEEVPCLMGEIKELWHSWSLLLVLDVTRGRTAKKDNEFTRLHKGQRHVEVTISSQTWRVVIPARRAD